MAVAFPADLQPMTQASKVRTQDAVYSIAAPRQALAEVGAAGTDKPVVWECTFVYRKADAKTFVEWFYGDLEGGALLAALPIKTEFGLITHDVRFLDDGPLAAQQVGELWRYTARVMAREQVIPEEAVQAYAGAFDGPIPDQDLDPAFTFTLDLNDYWTGGVGPFTWVIVSGLLPPGVTLNEFTGIVSGTAHGGPGTWGDVVFRRVDVYCVARDSNPVDFLVAAACDPYLSYVRLLGYFEGPNNSTTIPEAISGTNFAVNADAKLTTSQAPFGSSSATFDGSSDYLLAPAVTPWNLHTTPYTIDVLVRPTDIGPGKQGIISNDAFTNGLNYNYVLEMNEDGTVAFLGRGGVSVNSGAPLVENEWSHIEVSGDGAGNHRMWVRGVYRASDTGTSYTTNTNTITVIGAHDPNSFGGGFSYYWKGQIKMPRITVGVQRHTGTADFAPPDSLLDYGAC